MKRDDKIEFITSRKGLSIAKYAIFRPLNAVLVH